MELVYVGLALEFALLLLTLLRTFRERTALRRFVNSANSPDAALASTAALPEPQASIAKRFVESVRVRSTLDESLVKALVQSSSESFAAPLAFQLLTHIGLMLVALLPAILTLVLLTFEVASIADHLQGSSDPGQVLQLRKDLEAAFLQVPIAFSNTAYLVSGLALVWSVAWWLGRPQIREACFNRALLDTAVRIRPGTSAPVSARLAHLIAPDRHLLRPILASTLWFVAVTSGWFILYEGATLKISNQEEPFYRVLPTKRPAYSVPPSIQLPAARGGNTEDVGRSAPTLYIGLEEAFTTSGENLAQLDNGDIKSLNKVKPSTVKELKVSAHEAVSVNAVVQLLLALKAERKQVPFFLVTRRVLAEGPPIYSTLRLTVADTPPPFPLFTLKMDGKQVTLTKDGAEPEIFSMASAHQEVRAASHRRLESVPDGRRPGTVAVKLGSDFQYGEFIALLGATDDACTGDRDCGLEGLGLRFVLVP